MISLYRISDNSYVKPRLEGATKRRCLLNFFEHFPVEETIILADKIKDETREWLEQNRTENGWQVEYIQGGSSAQGFRCAMERALEFDDEMPVYLVEDDYWHLSNSRKVLLEGIMRADYVTLYDAPDKYIPNPRSQFVNPLVDEHGGEITRVILAESSHWKMTNSTTCTFATTPGVLRRDWNTWKSYCFAHSGVTHPNDFHCFLALRDAGVSLISPLPGLSTHCEPEWLTPIVDWYKELECDT